jgi:hypothetical protein
MRRPHAAKSHLQQKSQREIKCGLCQPFNTFGAKARLNNLTYEVEIAGLCVWSLIAPERINRFVPNFKSLVLETRKKTEKRRNSANVYRVRFPTKTFPVLRKLSMIEKWRLKRSYMFRKGD